MYPNSSINTFCRIVEQDVMKFYEQPVWVASNFSKSDRTALHELMSDKDLVFKPADKGGALVVQDAVKYNNEILAQLANDKFYVKLRGDPTHSFQTEIKTFLENARSNDFITRPLFDFLYCQHPIRPVLYTLPKIHKSMTDPPGRPIVAQINSLLSPLSEYVDSFIKPFVHSLPSYIRDTTDFIEKISGVSDISEDVILLTLDITSLYTNISHNGGLEALRFYLENRDTTVMPPNQFILDMASYVLKYNYFSFDNEFYLQISGTSMGSIFAPNYANLFMGHFEEKFVYNPSVNIHKPKIVKWFRYIDDIFCMYKGNCDEVEAFVTLLNGFDENIKFTLDFSHTKVHFLDMWVINNDGKLSTTLYQKETDRNTLLLATSFHPPSLKESLPISQFYRLRRVCSSTDDFITKSTEMKAKFAQRGYSLECLEKAFTLALNKPRGEVLKKKTKKSKKFSVTCVTTYSPHSWAIKSIFKKYWHILTSDPELASTFKDPPLFSFRRGKNLRDHLVHADFQSQSMARHSQTLLSPLPNGNYRCGHCAQCNNTVKTFSFNHPHTGQKFPIKSIIMCTSTNVVYLIRCPCGLAYVGKTSRQLKQRISEHKSSIRRNDRDYPVAVHFNDFKHDISAFRFIGIEKVSLPKRGGNIDILLKQREAYWIYTLQTLSPSGLNDELQLSVML